MTPEGLVVLFYLWISISLIDIVGTDIMRFFDL
jgi:hypothetical protein